MMGVTCAKAMSADGVNEIFISPEDADVVSMLETVHDELIHVDDDCASGHRGEFKEMAALLGLTGKLTRLRGRSRAGRQAGSDGRGDGTLPRSSDDLGGRQAGCERRWSGHLRPQASDRPDAEALMPDGPGGRLLGLHRAAGPEVDRGRQPNLPEGHEMMAEMRYRGGKYRIAQHIAGEILTRKGDRSA